MKKNTKNMLLSFLTASMLVTAVAGTAIAINLSILQADASNSAGYTLSMVDGAAIRMAKPLGLRFIAELSEDAYTDLMDEEAGVSKKMGMYIAPFDYLDDINGDYQNLAKKIDLVFYDSEGTVENKIYEYTTEKGDTVYRANGVITDLYLQNYARDFVGIAYIAETVGKKTTYTYADIDEDLNVRNAAYVAIEAYEDYTDSQPRGVFSQYVWGAHLFDSGMTQQNGGYVYNGQTYATVTEAAKNLSWSLELEKSTVYIKNVGDSYTLNATVKGDGKVVDFNGMHINWSSADESIVRIDDSGKMYAVGEGVTKVTASFMGLKKTCEVIVSNIGFEDGKVPSWFTGARVQSFTATNMYNGKVMEVKSTSDAYGDICVIMPRATIGAFFEDESVEYFAFDLMLPADATSTLAQVMFKGGNGNFAAYESGTYNTPPIGVFKSYYIARSTYEQWIANGVTDTRILNVTKGVANGMSLYIDNVRAVTADEFVEDWFSFEYGGIRNNSTQALLYDRAGQGDWQLCIDKIDSSTAKYTSEYATDGSRGLQFTKNTNNPVVLKLNHNTETSMETLLREAVYISYDLYVPEGSDAKTLWGSYYGGTLQPGWNTIYAQVDSSDNNICYLTDTTNSTYVIDNIQFITEEEFYDNAYSFENGAATIRVDNAVGTFYWYGALDRRKNVYSMAITGSPSNPTISSENAHDGDYSLKFEKTGDIAIQFRADSEMYANLHNGFSFWIYSTVGINGTTTNNLLNGNSGKLNGGAGMTIPANTWTQIVLTKDDIVQGTGDAGCKFLRIVGSTNGTYYIDGIKALPEATTITLIDGTQTKTQSVYVGYGYALYTPETYTREFLGWYDESGNKVEVSGVWTLKEDVTLTARFSDVKAIDFEDDILPSYLTKTSQTASLSVVELNGSKVLKMQGSASGTNHGLNVPLGFLAEYFADPNVQFVAFDVKSEQTQSTNFRRSTIRTTGTVGSWGQEPYEADVQADDTQVLGYRPDAFKTFFFSRTDYNNWVNNNKTVEMLISAGNFAAGESLYVDNIRPATQAEYNAANYGLETGGIRPNGGNLLVYYANTGSTWQYAITADNVSGSRPTFSSFGFTNENVTEGNRALVFTKTAGTVTMRFNSTSVANFKAIANPTGYYAFDLYVSADSDATIRYPNMANDALPGHAPNKGGWMTIYCQNDTNVGAILTDTTGGTYMLDNFRSVTEEEYLAAQNGFEAGTMGLRLNLLNDANTNSGAAYVYNKGADYNSVFASLSIGEGNGTNDGNALSNVRFDSNITHGGDFSLAFDKGNGYMAMSRHANSQAIQNFAGGFTFWIYSTEEIDGASGVKFYNGVNARFYGGEGLIIPANTWTQIVVTAEDIGNGRFLILQGNWKSTIYIDDFQLLGEPYTITYDAAGGSLDSNTQTVFTGVTYQLKTPTFDREFLGWVDEEGNPVAMSGIWELQRDVVLTATYAPPPKHTYKASVNEDSDLYTDLILQESTYSSSAGAATLPKAATDYEDMSYFRLNGSYGLNDFIAFDFTGHNMPIMSFFNNSVVNTIYNHAQNADVKGWIVTNGMYITTDLFYGGFAGAHANRITLIGPYNISYAYDDNGTDQPIKQIRTSFGSVENPSPAAMAQLNPEDEYRVIIGWVESGTNMNLRMIVWNLTTGKQIADYNQGGVPKADWKGDIVFYGHYYRETVVDTIYPVVNGLDNALQAYTPSMLTDDVVWDGNSATLAAGTYVGNVAYPTISDMSYIAFNGKYGSGDYVVFDITGSNMPIVSFFNNKITNTIYNNNGTGSTATVKDDTLTGWIWANGLYQTGGSILGGETGTHASRLALIGKQKVIGYSENTNGFRVNLGNASDVNPLSIRSLLDVTDTYRIIIGIRANGSKSIVDMAAINMITGALVYKYSWEVSTAVSEDGSIILYGQFGKETVLDSVFGVEEDTTLDALIAKYAKDTDYSDEEAVTLDRYGYSSMSDGTYTIDSTTYHASDNSVCSGTNCTSASHVDPRKNQATYDTYAAAGFNILFPQTVFNTDSSKWSETKVYMDKAANAGLKVILNDWHIQVLSTPVSISSQTKKPANATSSADYAPWILQSDVAATDENGNVTAVKDGATEAQAYLEAMNAAGLKIKVKFKDQNALDAFLMNELKPYKDHEAFYGVMLGDEPTYHNAYCYGQVYRALKRIMPEIYVQYNLLPLEQNLSTIQYRYPGLYNKSSATNQDLEEAYKAYVKGFVGNMGTDYIQYDDYPFKSAEEGFFIWTETVPYVDNTALRCIQIIAEIANELDLAVKVVTQSCLMRTSGSDGPIHIRQIKEADARWLNNYLMGFGVKQINYFTYWTKSTNSSSGEYYEDGGSFVDRDGDTTAVYNFMKEIMADNTAFAPTISHFDYSDSHVYGSDSDSNLNNDHISWSSSLTDNNYSFKWIKNVTTSKEYTLVTELYDAERYNYMYMVMNTIDPNSGGTQSITITLNDRSVTKFYVYDQEGNRTLQTGNTYTVSLKAGQAIYIMPCAW